jgi:hypothetical protein
LRRLAILPSVISQRDLVRAANQALTLEEAPARGEWVALTLRA